MGKIYYITLAFLLVGVIGISYAGFWNQNKSPAEFNPATISQKENQSSATRNREPLPNKNLSLNRYPNFDADMFFEKIEEIKQISKQDLLVQNNLSGNDEIPPEKPEKEYPFLFPDEYISYLEDVKNLMKDDNIIIDNSLTTNNDVLEFLDQLIDYFYNKGFINREQQKNFHEGVRINFVFLKNEYDQGFISNSGNYKPGKLTSFEFFESFLVVTKNIFGVSAALAQAECYVGRVPTGIPGFNQFISCCNCGLYRHHDHYHYTNDCGIPSVCDIDLGCLNRLAGRTGNAIWDPMTRICGFD